MTSLIDTLRQLRQTIETVRTNIENINPTIEHTQQYRYAIGFLTDIGQELNGSNDMLRIKLEQATNKCQHEWIIDRNAYDPCHTCFICSKCGKER